MCNFFIAFGCLTCVVLCVYVYFVSASLSKTICRTFHEILKKFKKDPIIISLVLKMDFSQTKEGYCTEGLYIICMKVALVSCLLVYRRA